jgi:two-component system chemotaxis response regulator CheY
MPNALVIDDSSTARLYYREILEDIDFVVEEAINGLEGLEKVVNQSFDIVVVDVNMPKMDGYSFLNQLRRAADVHALPAIMISTEGREADHVKAYAAGANFYIVKPVNPADLVAHALLMTGRPRHQSSRP